MERELKKRLAILFGFVFIDLLGYSLILPLLPYYADNFGASLTMVGLLGTANAAAQLLAAPFIGRLSDRYGRRPLLIFSIIGTFFSFLVLGLAKSFAMLLISRIMDGLLGGNISLARAYITDITDDSNRSRGMGIIGAAFGLGFIFGPAMGGLLSRFGYNVPALVSAGLSLVALLVVIIWLPESLSSEQRQHLRRSEHTRMSLQKLVEELRRPCVGGLLNMQLFYALAFTLFQANFALFVKQKLDLSAQSTSFVLTYVGLLSVIVQGVAIGWLTTRIKERSLILYGSGLLAVSLFLWAFTPNVVYLLVALTPIALAAGVLGTVLNSELTRSVYKEDVGGTLGLAASLQSFAQIVAPGLGGLLLQKVGLWSPGVLAGGIMLATTLYIGRWLMKQPQSSGPCPRIGEGDSVPSIV